MKKKLYLILGLALSLSMFNSCMSDEEFLTEDPKTIYTKDNAFEKAEQIDAALVRAYNKFNDLNGYAVSFFGDGTPNFLHGEGSDVLGGARGKNDLGGFTNYWALQSTNGSFAQTWTSLYQLASYANLTLEGLKIIENVDAEQAKYLEAQARFLRGWAYLRLAECFGGVPIVEEFNEVLKFDYARATREETYTFAIEDFKFAAANLPAYPKQDGRIAQGVANHFLAEAYLGRGVETANKADYGLAIAAADAVIKAHPLMTERFGSRSPQGKQPAGIPDNGAPRVIDETYKLNGEVANPYFDLFVIGNYAYSEGNTESLMIFEQPTYEMAAVYGANILPFAVTCGAIYRDITWNPAKTAEYSALGLAGGPWKGKFNPVEFPGGWGGLKFTCSWGLISSLDYSDHYVWRDEFAADDRNSQIVRWSPTVGQLGSPDYGEICDPMDLQDPAMHARVSCKITTWDVWGWNIQQANLMGAPFGNQYGRDWYIARSAETYLLRAEAKLRNGDAAGAADDINAVRQRSHATKLYTAGELEGDNGIYVILDERARELAWEEMRWPTLLRMGGQDKNEIMHTQLEKFSQGTYDVPNGNPGEGFKGKTFPEWTLFAIPYDVIQLNKEAEITQNKGWK